MTTFVSYNITPAKVEPPGTKLSTNAKSAFSLSSRQQSVSELSLKALRPVCASLANILLKSAIKF